MITKEQILERRAQLDNDLEALRMRAADANAKVQGGQREAQNCCDLINALSGAKQTCDFFLAMFPADPPLTASSAEGTEAPKEPIN